MDDGRRGEFGDRQIVKRVCDPSTPSLFSDSCRIKNRGRSIQRALSADSGQMSVDPGQRNRGRRSRQLPLGMPAREF